MESSKANTKLKLQPGESASSCQPIIELIGSGRYVYLWIGNDAPDNKQCFAAVSGPAKIRKFCEAALKAIGEN